jgi:hypothetical protein
MQGSIEKRPSSPSRKFSSLPVPFYTRIHLSAALESSSRVSMHSSLDCTAGCEVDWPFDALSGSAAAAERIDGRRHQTGGRQLKASTASESSVLSATQPRIYKKRERGRSERFNDHDPGLFLQPRYVSSLPWSQVKEFKPKKSAAQSGRLFDARFANMYV